jgi:RNA polymerase sigma-70 factor, ECF subfamily
VNSALSDEELAAKYREAGGHPLGTPFADALFSRHYDRVALWCFRILGDRNAAADMAQEVFVKAWQHLESFRSDAKFSTWLYTVTRNHCFNEIKRLGRAREEAMEAEHLDLLGAVAAASDSAAEQAQMIGVARSLMASELTETEAQVMTLHYTEELPLDAISRLLKMDNASGAKAYLVSAKRKLKVAVDRWTARQSKPAGRQT